MNNSAIYFAQKTQNPTGDATQPNGEHDYRILSARCVLSQMLPRGIKEMATLYRFDFERAGVFFENADYRLLLIGIDFKLHPLVDTMFDPVDCIQFLLDESSVIDRINDHVVSDARDVLSEITKICRELNKLDADAAKAVWVLLCYGQHDIDDPIMKTGWWSPESLTTSSKSSNQADREPDSTWL